MKISDILEIMRNKLGTLQTQRDAMFAAGDLASVETLDASIAETQTTIVKLETLPQ